jgi:hypothetical protein
MPTANYAAELFEIFRKGAVERFEIELDDKSAAFALRYRLNKLRADMRKEQHYMLDVAEGVSFVIKKPNENVLVVMPADMNYLRNIRSAIGAPSAEAIKAQEAIPLQTTTNKGPQLSSEDALDAFFEGTRKETGT